ncbi:Saccharopine dehydrogenase-domain-containing protein [Suillus fuscotomentosus]|uniref:Saccharopine dehydrogenase-domain-containing protein n=1 Tax=Suillus fuscotomentosus TaxID=1912939 RepID=A0AAD4ECH7_9AGAM|nr:Saccharopine dehydrogenase-domain-containing protein [Suillus fuscotomentosus]KAG1903451.1 Saccharopine dehydrogenase-domain-containing protein [Suillus fuscotomentosus]
MTIASLRRSPQYLPRPLAKRTYSLPARRTLATVSPEHAKVTVGIRREDPSRIWERRCPVTPDEVAQLVQHLDVNVLIQDCDRRVFPVDQFIKAGAKLHPTLEPAHIVLGIKETPLNELVTSPVSAPALRSGPSIPRTHLMFSHTTKGQPYNMELLSRFLGSHENPSLPRLIDYELLVGKDGKRTVGFGWFAGVAGVLESLSALAHAHLELGVASPFLHTPRPHTHPSIPSLRSALRSIGQNIADNGTPKALGPFVIGLTGSGNVTQGCLSILDELPIVNVAVKDLPGLVSNPGTDLHKIYLVHALPQDYLTRSDGGQYSRDDYYKNPTMYHSDFDTKIAPYLTLFLNGVGWLPSFPRLMTNEQLATALTRAAEVGRARFGVVGDISCDVEGGLEFLPRASTLSDPFFKHRPSSLPSHLPSVTIMSVDILPSSLPLDASQHFCGVLMPYLRALIDEYHGRPGSREHLEALNVATIARNGELQGKHRGLAAHVERWQASRAAEIASKAGVAETSLRKKRVLMLGSGMVAGPAVQEICKRSDVEIIVAGNVRSETEDLTRKFSNAKAAYLDVHDAAEMARLIQGADVVISLLPVPFHPAVAELCIQHRKHLVTASYISPAMRTLHERAQSADVLLLNEIGLDPGIDHCSALSLLAQLQRDKKRVISFTSFCGGLPAPDCADVPLGYKFSWSPRGVLNAALNGAQFKLDGKEMKISGNNLLQEYFPDIPISHVLKLEGLANRDSLPYAETYGLGKLENLQTVLRGTLRYPGFADLMHAFKIIGLLDTETSIHLRDWRDLARVSLEKRIGEQIGSDRRSFLSALSTVMTAERAESALSALDWLGLTPENVLSKTPLATPLKPQAPIELFTSVLAHKLRYNPGERDMVVLSHEIVAQPSLPSIDSATEVHTSSLVAYGNSEASAMARCVGLPVAFAALEVLYGNVQVRGVHGPTDRGLYGAVLDGLQGAGLEMKESVRKGPGMERVLAEGLNARRVAL